ncbi:hypothetical protein BGM26_02925 [Bacillus sp. FJAT-29790]|uniref:hypothetical protein n=1 Tax=Bacillus sp. FJAT-29790 TaxID=1895002 RepID=UPI001C21BCF5|nr:hypothetical protein [Bacillus sp. FJAT-29790]MBU8877946.1 hypothetical protein [Bacillus sp. FJAT-29790]
MGMGICCGACHNELKDDDIVTMDIMNKLTHLTCSDLDTELIKNINTFENIKQKYWFYRMELVD